MLKSSHGQVTADPASSNLRGQRLFALGLLLIAVALAAILRFQKLSLATMDGDEGASWAAAIAPNVHAVSAVEQQLDPGKLALYDLLLHGWIGLFGDSLFSMRAMSAGLGTIVVLLVFIAVREVCRSLGDACAGITGELAGAFAGLIYATNLTMVLSDRAVRMYPLVMGAELLQTTFLVRAQRRGGLVTYAGVAIFTAIMIASNFTASFLLIAEGLWFVGLLLYRRWADASTRELGIVRPGLAIIAGIALLAPVLPGAIKTAKGAVDYGAINWIGMQPLSWPITALRAAVGKGKLFWLFLALGILGVVRQSRHARLALGFFAAWLVGPFLAVMAVTYLIKPLELPRYVIVAFVAMFAFAGLGAASLRYIVAMAGIAGLLVFLSVGAVHKSIKHSRQEAWATATSLAAANAQENDRIAVFPAWTVNVARYYSPPERRNYVIGVDSECGAARVLILLNWSIATPDEIAKVRACYPRLIERLSKMEVRAR